jgi:uncharacterized protein
MNETPRIWVDADACPVPIKEILFRAAQRAQISVTLVANHALRVPPSPYIRSIQVPGGFDVADNEITRQVVALISLLHRTFRSPPQSSAKARWP